MPETWTWGQWFSLNIEDVGFKTTIMPGENPAGKEQRNSEGQARLVFSFPLKYKTKAEKDAIYAFYVARKGAYEPFYITVDGTQYLVARERARRASLDRSEPPARGDDVLDLAAKNLAYYAPHPPAIVLDQRWQRELDARTSQLFGEIAGPLNERFAWLRS